MGVGRGQRRGYKRSLLLIRSQSAEMLLYPVLSVYVFIFRCVPVNDCRQVPESVGPELIRWLPGRNCRHKELHPSCTQQQWVIVLKKQCQEIFARFFSGISFSLVMNFAVSSVRICGYIRYVGLPTGVNETTTQALTDGR